MNLLHHTEACGHLATSDKQPIINNDFVCVSTGSPKICFNIDDDKKLKILSSKACNF